MVAQRQRHTDRLAAPQHRPQPTNTTRTQPFVIVYDDIRWLISLFLSPSPHPPSSLLLFTPFTLHPSPHPPLLSSGFKIPHIENLGVTNDEYEVIDLSDNDLTKLDNFPTLKRMEMLLVSNNRINKIALELYRNLPTLDSLVRYTPTFIQTDNTHARCISEQPGRMATVLMTLACILPSRAPSSEK